MNELKSTLDVAVVFIAVVHFVFTLSQVARVASFKLIDKSNIKLLIARTCMLLLAGALFFFYTPEELIVYSFIVFFLVVDTLQNGLVETVKELQTRKRTAEIEAEYEYHINKNKKNQ